MTHENATPRPWTYTPPFRVVPGPLVCQVTRNGQHGIAVSGLYMPLGGAPEDEPEANAALIVEAVNAYDTLTADRDRLAAENERLRKERDELLTRLGVTIDARVPE